MSMSSVTTARYDDKNLSAEELSALCNSHEQSILDGIFDIKSELACFLCDNTDVQSVFTLW
jgi:hypothetical protein